METAKNRIEGLQSKMFLEVLISLKFSFGMLGVPVKWKDKRFWLAVQNPGADGVQRGIRKEFFFGAWESMQAEHSCKYTQSEIEGLTEKSGWRIVKHLFDTRARFLIPSGR